MPGLNVDNAPKRILDAMEGIVYNKDEQVRSVKSVGLRLDRSLYARGFNKVFQRDVYLVDSTTPGDEKPSVVMLAKAPVLDMRVSVKRANKEPTP